MTTLCPICKKPVEYPYDKASSSPSSHFPFCSERCKLIDLGRWLDGKYQIPVVKDDEGATGESPEDSEN